MPDVAPKLVLVTGPSGAGRSTCINVLEDLGFEAIDNLPLSLIGKLLSGAPATRPLALGLDVRNRDFSAKAVLKALEDAKGPFGYDAELLYLDSSDNALLRRYSETRRRHPLAPQNTPQEGIALEKEMLATLRLHAESLIDTSDLTPHDLRAELARRFGQHEDARLAVSIHSFSYKRGLPRGADMVLDARFLQNPHWEPELRMLTGRDAPVQAYVASDPRFGSFFDKTRDLVLELLPAYRAEGKAHFVIAFGCTGGRHRSVTLAERMAKALAEKSWQVSIKHRELEREGQGAAPSQGDTPL